MKDIHRSQGTTFLLVGFQGYQQLPVTALCCQFFTQVLFANRLQEYFQILFQPAPFIIRKFGHQPGIGRAVGTLPAAEENLSTHHAHAGAVTQNILSIFRTYSADNSNPACHKFRK